VNDTYSGPSLYGSDADRDAEVERQTTEAEAAMIDLGADEPTTTEVDERPALNEHGQSVPLRSTFPDTIEVPR